MTLYIILTALIAVLFVVQVVRLRRVNMSLRAEIDSANKQIGALLKNVELLKKRVVPEGEYKAALQKFENDKQFIEGELKFIEGNLNTEINKLKIELKNLKAEQDVIEAGFVRREFTFDDAKSYQEEIRNLEKSMVAMIRDGDAAVCIKKWSVQGSDAKGEAMIKKLIKLAVRAFNADADAAISRVKWNNYESLKGRILKCEETIEKALDEWGISISDTYRDYKVRELKLTFEKAEVEQREKEQQRDLKEQMREEEKVRREAEKAKVDAEREERKIQQALIEAKQELEAAHSADMSKYLMQIKELELQLNQVGEAKLRAISMAQLTRMGYVYIISNIGSFGENVYKIGMTRRLDPMDRVWELSDASVPFDFDVHAIIKCDDAPALEKVLHGKFNERRLNIVNDRKEFFSIGIDEIQRVVSGEGYDVQLTILAEAREHRESMALRKGS